MYVRSKHHAFFAFNLKEIKMVREYRVSIVN